MAAVASFHLASQRKIALGASDSRRQQLSSRQHPRVT
jgi:hypothetical protein